MKRKFSFFVLMLISAFTVLYAQISSRAIKPEELPKSVKYYQDMPLDYFELPFVDVEKLKKEDEAMKNKVEYLRYGKVVDVDLGFEQGKRIICQGGYKWYWAITSKDALSLDFAFDKFFLPEGAELHIYNTTKTMLIGPITAKHNNKKRKLSTFSLVGDSAVIELYVPIQVHDKTIFHISSIIHGYVNFLSGDSGDPVALTCTTHINANCAEGNTMENEKKAVTLLVSGGFRRCTGTLLNNACNNLRPNILTALHCIDGITTGIHNGEIDAAEEAVVSNMLFIFHYKTSSCAGNSASINVCFEGADVLNSQENSDMALLELEQQPNLSSDVHYAGWSNAVAVPNTAFGISHPGGNPMKLAFEDNAPVRETWDDWMPGDLLSWSVRWNRGAVEGGSSGSALFNPQNRVIGQLAGHDILENSDVCSGNRKFYGRFDASWNTIGPNLSDDPSVTTTNTIGIPYIDIPNQVCPNSPVSYINIPPNMQIVGSNISGAYLTNWWTIQPEQGFNGEGFLELQLTPIGITCNDPLILRKTFNVGLAQPQVQLYHNWDCSGWVYITNVTSGTNYNWTVSYGGQTYYTQGTSVYLPQSSTGNVYYYLEASNACNSTWIEGYRQLQGCGSPNFAKPADANTGKKYDWKMQLSPNPATNDLNISLSDYNDRLLHTLGDVKIFNMTGQLVHQSKQILDDHMRLNIQNLNNGFYILEIRGQDFATRQRFNVSR